ncbi:MAG: hypothetical protein ACOCXJ_04535 [Planctomycetota bacterium]
MSIYLTADQWRRLPERLSDPFFAGLAARNRRALDLIPADELCELPGRLGTDAPPTRWRWRHLKLRLQRATVAWFLDRDQRQAGHIRLVADEFLRDEHWRVFSDFYEAGLRHADLRTADTWYCVAFLIAVCGAELLGVERVAALRARLQADGLGAYRAGWAGEDWWYQCDFNWGAAVHGCAGLAALVLEDSDPAGSAAVLQLVRRGLSQVLGAVPPGGGWIEGIMYQTTTMAHITDLLAEWYRRHGEDLGLLDDRDWGDCFDFRIAMLGGDDRPLNFSNCEERTEEWRMAQAYWWAAQRQRADWTGFEDAHQRDWRITTGVFHDVEAFWFRPVQPALATARPPRLAHFHGIGWTAWHGERAWLGLRGGRLGGNHGNWDLGSVIFGIGAARVLIDPGYGAGAEQQHNVVQVRGRPMADAASARLLQLQELPDGGMYCCLELRETSPHVLLYHRRYVVVRDAALLLFDDIHCADGRRTSARFHLQTRVPLRPDGADHRLDVDGVGVAVRFLTRPADLQQESWEWAGLPVHTQRWRLLPDRTRTQCAVLLQEEGPIWPAWRCTDERASLQGGGWDLHIDLRSGRLATEDPV